jgi:hypothetical protein
LSFVVPKKATATATATATGPSGFWRLAFAFVVRVLCVARACCFWVADKGRQKKKGKKTLYVRTLFGQD